jgi:hypothetical protein
MQIKKRKESQGLLFGFFSALYQDFLSGTISSQYPLGQCSKLFISIFRMRGQCGKAIFKIFQRTLCLTAL